jgi:hypothetical protein
LNDRMVAVIIDDVSPLVNIAGILHAHGRTLRVQGESVTSFSDLRQVPSVFIGLTTTVGPFDLPLLSAITLRIIPR